MYNKRMSQYFENDKTLQDKPQILSFQINGKSYRLHSNSGVFSKDKLDTGTRILLETVLKEENRPSSVLDLGCGIGPVGIVCQKEWDARVTMIDINEKAVELAKKNIVENHVQAHVFCQDGVREGQFECILLNPPIRTGKKVIYRLFDECLEHLENDGRFWLVMRKQHGAQSAIQYLEEKECTVRKVNRDKGFWVFVAQKKSIAQASRI